MAFAKNRMDIELFPGCDFSDVKVFFLANEIWSFNVLRKLN